MSVDQVVLVHGLTASAHWWRSTVEALEPDYEVHVIRLPGIPYREAAEWLGDRLIREGSAGATVVGHSMGGTVALLAAAEKPEAVGRLALIAPAGIFSSRRRRSFVVPIVRSLGRSPGRLALAARDAARIGPVRLWRVASDLLASDVSPVLGSVQAPTLVVWGADDRLLPPTLGSVFADEIPDSRLVVLERCGHIPMLERPDGLNAALRAFLEEGENGMLVPS
jgi:pimeloyl-ACP methyl ester carboxylesterase